MNHYFQNVSDVSVIQKWWSSRLLPSTDVQKKISDGKPVDFTKEANTLVIAVE